MAHLVACLGSGKGTWTELSKIINSKLFNKVYLITNDFGIQTYTKPDIVGISIELIRLDLDKPVEDMVSDLYVALKQNFSKDKLQELDIAVNITSGTGKEHAVVISTLMKLGYGIRLIELDKDGNILEMI